jgi:predicted PurR-regulated permease PerM
MTGYNNDLSRTTFSTSTIDLAIRLGFLCLVGYWSLKVIAPFLTILLWSAILTVALYPVFDWLARRLPRPGLAAALVTLLCLMVIVGPVAWLGFGLIGAIGSLIKALDAGQLVIPLPADSVKLWPLVGEKLHSIWSLAATNLKAALIELAPQLTPVGGKLLDVAQSAFLGFLELLVSIVVAGCLFTRGPQFVDAFSAFLGRVLSHRGKETVQLVGATIRNVSRGVVGVALLQSILAGAGFLAANVPSASVFAFLTLLLSIAQIGPSILLIPITIWSWTAMEAKYALLFTAYMIPVGLLDNVLRPLLMARGLTTPMPIIMVGVIGGTIAYGIVGLFFGPMVLSVAWAVMVTWVWADNPGLAPQYGPDAEKASSEISTPPPG